LPAWQQSLRESAAYAAASGNAWQLPAIYLFIHAKTNPAIPPSKKTHKALFHGPLADFQQQQKQYSQPSNNPPLKVWHGVCSID
jgi:hypothetical protein